MSKLQALLCCVILTLSMAAIVKNQGANAPIELPTHPSDDPIFADFKQWDADFNPPSDSPALLLQYRMALDAYDHELNIATRVREDSAETRDILVGWIVAVFLFLALTWLPWRRWGDKTSEATSVAAEEAGKLAARGYMAAKALAEPSPIVGRSGLKTYSVADELAKWSKLREEGVVSQEEFEEARAALLRRES